MNFSEHHPHIPDDALEYALYRALALSAITISKEYAKNHPDTVRWLNKKRKYIQHFPPFSHE